MRRISIAFGTLALVAGIAPAAHAQSSDITLQPGLTQNQFQELVADLGSILRFRQIGDTATLGKGGVDIGVQFANAPVDTARRSWSASFPRLAARFGVSDRVDVGAWGGINTNANYGVLGMDTKIALLAQGQSRSVSVSLRPSLTALVGPSDLWAANVGVDLAVSRTFGRLSPYAGIGASSSGAIARRDDVNLDPVSAGEALAFAGVSYRWRALSLGAEVEKGDEVRYGLRIGTRF